MKRSVLFLVSLFVVTIMVAAPVSKQRAMQVAQQFIPVPDDQAQAPGMRVEEQPADIVYTHPMPKSGRPAFYVVNVGGSFVIVSADDVAHQILGYNLGKNWPTIEDGALQLPPQVKGFFDDLAAQMEAAIEANPNHASDAEWSQPQSAPRRRMMSEMPDSVGPLLTTTWDQGQYYNALCPEDQNSPYDGHCPTGCVATAMAQIINYWGYPTHGRGIHSYETNYGTLEVNYDSAHYDFAHMPSQLTNASTPQEKNAVATLMRDCGVAVSMSYGSYESGADGTVIASALVDYFRMNPRLGETNSSYYTRKQWMDLLRDNISREQPVLYANENHEYILDGYNSDGYFHFNMGWGGSADGWYLLDTLYNQTAIVDIHPDSTANIIIGQSYGVSSYFVDSTIHFKHVYAESDYPHSIYTGGAHPQIVTFQLSDTSEQIVVDFMSYDEETPSLTMMFYDGNDTSSQLIRTLDTYGTIDKSPIVASAHQITIYYTCVHADTGFHLRIGKNGGCRVVSNVVANETAETKEITWTENGTATQWMVEYGVAGFNEGAGISTIVDTPFIMISGLPQDSTCEVRIRSVCIDNALDLWRSVTVNNYKYWTDVVFSKPDGYDEDSVGTIHISSEKGLAWIAKQHTRQGGSYSYTRKKIVIESDLDLGLYLWHPIAWWDGDVDGKGHIIRNLTVKEVGESGGLFGQIACDTIKDIGFVNANVTATDAGTIAYNCSNAIVLNSYSINHTISSSGFTAGGLFGAGGAKIINCFAIGSVNPAFSGGGIVADCGPQMYNCYSSVRRLSGLQVWKGLISAYTRGGTFENCFANIDYVKDTWSNSYVGTLYDNPNMGYFFGHPENIEYIKNVAGFTKRGTGIAHIVSDTSINCTIENGIDLETVLNEGVMRKNSPLLRNWVLDSITGFPVLGEYYSVTCPSVKDVAARNVLYHGAYAVAVSWQEEGESTEWQIKCVPDGTMEDSSFYVNTFSTNDTLTNLQLGRRYIIQVRPMCDNCTAEFWSEPLFFTFDKPYWDEMVLSKPSGYVEDDSGNIDIYTAEGLTWLAVCSNGLNGQQERNTYEGKTIRIREDIDLSSYKWRPISEGDGVNEFFFRGCINGYNHKISNLYCNETDKGAFSGFIARLSMSTINGINLSNCLIVNEKNCAGGLICFMENCTITNCNVDGIVKGVKSVGMLVGGIGETYQSIVNNCSTHGNVYCDAGAGGLIGTILANVKVTNCYSMVNVHRLGKNPVDYNGGLIGSVSGHVYNCYNVSEIDSLNNMYDEVASGTSMGLLCGYTGSIGSVSPILRNIYSKSINNVPFYATKWMVTDSCISDTAFFDQYGVLGTTIIIDNTPYTDLLSALNAWVDANNDNGQYRHWMADTAGVNGGFPIFAPMPKYVITFFNSDSSLLQRDTLDYGAIPMYRGEYPVKPATAQYTYIFKAWSPVITSVTEDATYTATFDSIVNRYVIIFQDEDSTLLQRDTLDYGAMPEYRGATPTKQATVQHTYTFAGWAPTVSSVTQDANYIATFDSVVNTYVVMFLNDDSTLLQIDTLAYGAMPEFHGATPIKQATAQYTYTFNGWNNAIVSVTGNAMYVATYVSMVNKYVVMFLNEDSTLLQIDTLAYGAMPEYRGVIPQREDTIGYRYKFVGWDKELVPVIGDATYIAKYELIPLVGIDTYEYPTLGECGEYSLASKWLYSNTLDNFRGNEPGGENYVRGMAVNDGKMYFVDREHAQLTIVDGATVKMLEPLPIVGEHLFQDIYPDCEGSDCYRTCVALPFNDIQFDSAGHCLISSGSTSSPSYNRAMVYVVDLETGLATELISERINDNPAYAEDSWRMDAISVYGDVTDHAVIMFGNSMNADLHAAYKWEINNGVAGPAERIDLIVSPDDDSYLWRSDSTLSTENISACRVHIVDDNHFYWDHHSCFPTLFSMDGTLAGDLKSCPTGMRIPMDNDTITMNYGHNGVCEFRIGEENFLIMAATNNLVRPASSYAIFKFTDQSKSFSSLVPMWFLPKDGMGIATNGPRVAVPSVEVHDTVATIYLYTQNNGYGVYEMVSRPKCTIVTHADSLQGQIIGGGTYLKNTEVHLVAVPKEGYNFVQWSDGCTDIERTILLSQDTSMTALFEIQRFTIVFRDEDSTLLQVDTLEYGTWPEYRGTSPIKASTAQYTYTFAGWSPVIASVTGNAVYEARYTATVNKYIIMFLNEDSTLLQIDTLAYGAMPEFHGATPIKQATAQYTYTFNGWNNAVVSVTGDAMYVATYVSMVNKYVVMFMNEDSTLLQIDTLAYGAMPVYRGQTPSKASTAQYTYSFAGWTPAVVTVTQNATYTATYTETENKYVVIFQDMDGTQLQVDTLNYGLTPVFRGTPPTKENTAQYSYSFAGWTPQITAVTGNITYTAIIDSVVNKYVIMFLNEDSTLLQIDTLAYGAMPEYRGEEPVKPNEGDYFYVFTGWEPEAVPVVGDAIYVATYESHGTGLDNVAEKQKPVKVMEDGKLYILLPDGTKYSATGKKVE